MPVHLHMHPGSSTPPSLPALVDGIDRLADLGVNTKHTGLKPIRRAAARVRELREQSATIRQRSADDEMRRVVDGYASGEIDAEQLPARIAALDAVHPKSTTLTRVLDRAEAVASAPGGDAARALSDAWIVEVLRPGVDGLLAQIDDRLIEDAWRAIHLPDHELKRDRTRRDALDKLTDLLAKLDTIHDTATGLRNYGYVPTPPRRAGWFHEDFRWLHHDRLDGTTSDYLPFWLRSWLSGAECGLWTADELLQANPSLRDSEPSSDHTDARTRNGGRRVVA